MWIWVCLLRSSEAAFNLKSQWPACAAAVTIMISTPIACARDTRVLTAQRPTNAPCMQISMFIDGSSEFAAAGAANTNEYYAISYTTDIEDRTNTFNANAFGGVAQQVSSFTVAGGGSKDTSVALTDVFRRFVLQRDGLPSDARFAFVITDGFGDSLSAVTRAADLLSGEEVVVIAFPPNGAYNQNVVDAIATDQSGTTRVVPVTDYATLASVMSSTLATIGACLDPARDAA